MTGTSVRGSDSDWGHETHYGSGGAVLEPRTFTEADPMTGVLLLDWDALDADSWSSPTLAGRPQRGRRRRGSDTDQPADNLMAAEATDTAQQVGETNRSMLANSRSMAVASLVSRLTGFIRTIAIVAALGLGSVGNAYNSGNTFPNMVYELLLGGVLSSVLIPLLVHAQVQDDDDGMAYTQRLLSLATVALGVLTFAAVLAAPLIAGAFAPAGFRGLTTTFATLLLPEIFFYGLGAMFMAILNIRHSYAPGAWSPVLNNVIMILTLAVFWALPGPNTLRPSTITTAQIVVIGVGTTLGIAAQALVLLPALRRTGFRWQWRFRALPNEAGRMREVGSLAGWVLGYVVASQVGVSVIQRVGNYNNGYSIFTQADLLFQMPYGIMVVSLLTAIMPRLSRAAVNGDNAAVTGDLSLGARLSAVALIPVTAGLIVLGSPLGVTLFAHGQTTLASAQTTGTALALSAFGLFPFALVMLQLRVFYAMRDGRTPTLINIGMVATKVVLVLVTDGLLRGSHREAAIEWLNIATSMSYVVGAIIGHILLTRRLGPLGFGPVARTAGQIGAASVVGAGAAWGVVRLAHDWLGEDRSGSLVALVGGAVIGLAVLTLLLWRLRSADVREVMALARR